MQNSSIKIKSQEILNFFNAIPYGVIADEKLYTGHQLNDEIFWQKWRMLDTLQVINYNGGICWDISSAVKTFLDQMQIQNYEIYCEMNNESKSSHSFNIVYQNDSTCYILDGSLTLQTLQFNYRMKSTTIRIVLFFMPLTF